MDQSADLQNKMQRMAAIVEQLESAGDPNTRAMAKELLESLMALHGAGLERILEIAGEDIVAKCSRDEVVSGILLLYGLHPDNLVTRAQRAVDKSLSALELHGAYAELKSIGDDGTITVLLHHKPNGGCGATGAGARSVLEANLQNAAPDACSILIEETGAELSTAAFVSVAQLQGGQSIAASFASRAIRSSD
jgi:hypothetical protein